MIGDSDNLCLPVDERRVALHGKRRHRLRLRRGYAGELQRPVDAAAVRKIVDLRLRGAEPGSIDRAPYASAVSSFAGSMSIANTSAAPHARARGRNFRTRFLTSRTDLGASLAVMSREALNTHCMTSER